MFVYTRRLQQFRHSLLVRRHLRFKVQGDHCEHMMVSVFTPRRADRLHYGHCLPGGGLEVNEA